MDDKKKKRYFAEKGFLLKNLTSRDIQDFYTLQLERVSANTVIPAIDA